MIQSELRQEENVIEIVVKDVYLFEPQKYLVKINWMKILLKLSTKIVLFENKITKMFWKKK